MGLSSRGLPPINWFGLIAGVLMLALPFMGPWWHGVAGTGAAEIALSPFDVHFSFLGQPLHSSLIGLFLLAAKIAMIIAGAFMIAGSVFAKRWWSRRLVRFGVMKPFWAIIMLIALVLTGAVVFNYVMPGVISGMTGGAVQPENLDINIPYVVGGPENSTISVGGAFTVTIPVTAYLTGVFWVAVFVAALGIAARIYHRRFVKPTVLKIEKPEKPKK